jgi:hypothetical protein
VSLTEIYYLIFVTLSNMKRKHRKIKKDMQLYNIPRIYI